MDKRTKIMLGIAVCGLAFSWVCIAIMYSSF